MQFHILTLFPEMFSALNSSIIGRAQKHNVIGINLYNLRDWATDKYKTVDDRPYGGGIGMILKVDVIDRAITDIKAKINSDKKTRVLLFDAKGSTYNQAKAQNLSKNDHLILICGHYEGVDHRVFKLVDEVVSVGNYIVTGGELPAMIIIDSITRLLKTTFIKPGVAEDESFSQPTFESPQYTRPAKYKNMSVPQVLLSGHHSQIEVWKKSHSRPVKPNSSKTK